MDKVHKFDLASEAFVKDAADLRDLVSKTIAYDASMYVTEEICRKYLRHRHELSQSVPASTATFADLDRGDFAVFMLEHLREILLWLYTEEWTGVLA